MNQGPDKKIMVVLAIACLLIIAYAVAGVVEGAHADEPMECTDQMVPLAPAKATEASAQVAAAAFEAPEEEPVEEYVEEYADYGYQDAGYYGGGYEVPYSDLYNTDGPTRNMPGWHDGYVETYYDASGHFMAGDWSVDPEGFYHDSEGRYVIGVDINSGLNYGDVVDTGRGEAVVYDYGAGVSNVHDFAVAGAPNR